MLHGKKIVVVLPAYHAEKTLVKTYNDIPHDIVDTVVLVDDHSSDRTVEVGKGLGIEHIVVHDRTVATVETRRPATPMPSGLEQTSS